MSARDAAAAAFFKATNPDATEDLAAQTDFVREGSMIDADRFLAALSAAGYAIVPVKATEAMVDGPRHIFQWLAFGDRPTERSLMQHCARLRKPMPEDCNDVDHVPPKALQAAWVWSAMIAASQEEGK